MRTLLFLLLLLPLSALGQVREADVAPGDNPSPEALPENVQEGDLNQNTQVQGNNIEGSYNTTKQYNGAGSSGMPVYSSVAPSLMSNGTESCLKSITGGMQLVGIGLSSGKYLQDEECNRRRDSITLSNMGMKVAAVSLMCQSPQVWKAMFMSATPCPIIRGGRLIVGKSALLAIKQDPELHIPNYKKEKELYDKLLGVNADETVESDNTTSISERFRTSVSQ